MEYRDFVKTLRRLYLAGSITKATIDAKRAAWKLTDEEYAYIIGEAGE